MQAAINLWNIIKQKAGVTVDLQFLADNSLPAGAYCVKGTTVTHNSTTANPGAVYAVARIAEELFDAIMIRPDAEGIIIQRFGSWRDLNISYTPTLERNNYVNVNASGWDRTWMHWHHVPTEGSGGSDFHKSWFLGLAQKYPQLAPAGNVVENTKPDITHPDFPAIIYSEWERRGRPDVCSLFEIDGTQFWWLIKHCPPPAYLNPGEINRYAVALGSNIPRPGDGKKQNVNGVAYTLTDNLTWAQVNMPRNNRYSQQDQDRFNLTGYYLKMYKDVERYFDKQGAKHVRFNVLGYSAYRCMPDNVYIDLSRFNVYYTSPLASAWSLEEMLIDSDQFLNHEAN